MASVIAIIPARGGSKRLAGKNLRALAGKPLLAHTVGHARASAHVTRTVVSTEDAEIASVARSCGAQVIERPAALAGDEATSEAVLAHALESLQAEGFVPELVVFLQCTSPIRSPGDIDGAIELLLERGWDSVLSATRSHALLWREGPDGPVPMNYDVQRRPRDQDHAPEFRENGSIYVFRPWVLERTGARVGGRIGIYEMPFWSSVQVDTEEELELCEWILRRQGSAPTELLAEVRAVVLDFDGVLTDNRVLTFPDGTEAVLGDRSDSLGLAQLRRLGLPVVVLSTEAHPVVGARCAKLGLRCVQGVQDKPSALEELLRELGVSPAQVAYVGNDLNDLACIQRVGWGIAVGDAHPQVRAAARLQLRHRGGQGAVRELCDLLLAHRTAPAATELTA